MSSQKDKAIEQMEKETRRLEYIERNNLHANSICKHAFGSDRCTSGSNRGDYCTYNNPHECPYNE